MLEVGQKLWFVDQHSYRKASERGHEVTITKIGRKWATIGPGLRIDLQTLWADGGAYSSPGRCYLSADDYLSEMAKVDLWRDFSSRVSRYNPPNGVTVETIRQVADLLGIPLQP